MENVRPDIADLVQRIRAEYREMPGLCLTEAQAKRVWQLEKNLCTAIFAELVHDKFLMRTRAGAFVRVE